MIAASILNCEYVILKIMMDKSFKYIKTQFLYLILFILTKLLNIKNAHKL